MAEKPMSFAHQLIEKSLNDALEQYDENPSRETFLRILDQLVRAYVFNLPAAYSFEADSTGVHYKLYETPDYGYAYCVYTITGQNPDSKEPETLGFLPWRSILSMAAENNACTGIVINPCSGHQALVWVNPVYIRSVIQYARKTLEDMKRDEAQP